MYSLIKDKGYHSIVTLVNNDTKDSLLIGKISVRMLSILEEEGTSFTPEELREVWNTPISEEAGKKLAKEALSISKPVRTKKEPVEEVKEEVKEEEVKPVENTDKEPVDALSLIFGIVD